MTGIVQIDVSLACADWQDVLPEAEAIGVRAATAAYRAAADAPGRLGAAEASLVLADDAFVRTLNRDYRDRDEPTNVLSFANLDGPEPPQADDPAGPVLLGDMVVALETTAAEAAEAGKRISEHFSHLVVHGMLHLLGYDHQDDAQAERMERLEVRVLRDLGVADPYAECPEGRN